MDRQPVAHHSIGGNSHSSFIADLHAVRVRTACKGGSVSAASPSPCDFKFFFLSISPSSNSVSSSRKRTPRSAVESPQKAMGDDAV